MPESTDSAFQSATHSALLTALSENMNSMEVLKADECQTPSGSHQSSYLPDATRYANLLLSADIPMPLVFSLLLKSLGSSLHFNKLVDYKYCGFFFYFFMTAYLGKVVMHQASMILNL